MGVKQSKRSVDITEISTKGEIEGFGNEGKVEKIIDGVVEKVAANGHVEGDLQNGVEALQNGIEPIQNGEAAAVATEKVTENKSIDESPVEGEVVENGQMENGEIHEEAEKIEETKKSQDKKDKKKDKKDKVVKKKFSFRNFSFSKKDKSKPPKEEKSPEKVDEAGIEEVPTSPEKEEEVASPSEGQLAETPKAEEVTKQESESTLTTEVAVTVSEQSKQEIETAIEVNSKPSATLDDLPPPLPASPPPSEPLEARMVSDLKEIESSESGIIENSSGEINEIGSSISNFSPMPVDILPEDVKDQEQIVMETGKQIEEKATSLLKTVEERAEESMRTAGELMSQQKAGDMETVVGRVEMGGENVDAKEEMKEMAEDAKNAEEAVPTIPLEISNLGSISQKAEETSDKMEEGAGESLADIPKDLTEEVTGASMEVSGAAAPPSPPTPDAPPAVEEVAGE